MSTEHTDVTAARLAEIRARLAEASPGPWEQESFEPYILDAEGRYVAECESINGDNRRLICEAPSDLAWACDEIDRLTADLAAAEAYADVAVCPYCGRRYRPSVAREEAQHGAGVCERGADDGD